MDVGLATCPAAHSSFVLSLSKDQPMPIDPLDGAVSYREGAIVTAPSLADDTSAAYLANTPDL